MRNWIHVLLGLMFSWLLPAAAVNAGEQPKVVRIASIATPGEGGKLIVGGGQSSTLVTKGWLEEDLRKKGIALEWVPIPVGVGGPLFNEALANRTADFAAYGDFPAIIGKAGGIDTVVIVPAGRGTNSYLVTQPGLAARTIADLKGLRIAVQKGRPHELAFSLLLKANRLKYGDFRIFNLNSQAAGAALAAGSVDAIFTNSDAFLLADKGVGRIVWSTKGTNWQWRTELFVRRDFAELYPEITQIVATAYVKAAHWSALEENRDEVIRITSRTGTPESVIARDYAGDEIPWKERWSPLFDDLMEKHYRDAIDFTRSEKLIRNNIDVRQWFDPRYVRVALHDLRLEEFWNARNPNGKQQKP